MPNTKSAKSKQRDTNQLPPNHLAPVGAFKLTQARQYLGGISVPSMHRLIQRGLLKPNRCLRHLLFAKTELDRFLKSGMAE